MTVEKDSDKKVLLGGQHLSTPNQVAFVRSHSIPVSTVCFNQCSYCAFQGEGKPTVPYTTIKRHKEARQRHIRDVLLVGGERSYKFNDIRAILDLWGFEQYTDYLYTLSELAFLEGVMATLEVGFLSPIEMKAIKEIVLGLKIMVDTADPKLEDTHHKLSPGKRFELRLKTLEFAGKLKIPVSTGIMVGIDERKDSRIDALKAVAALHKQFDHIQDFTIQPFIPQKGTPMEKHKPASTDDIIWTARKAKEILPADIPLVVPFTGDVNLVSILAKEGVRSLGRFGHEDLVTQTKWAKLSELEKVLKKAGFELVEELPIRLKYLRKGWYSGKLSQLLDTFKIRLKKEEMDRPLGRKRGPRSKKQEEEILV